jgi:hypothetical protein
LTSSKWQDKFTESTRVFVELQTTLQQDLQVYVSSHILTVDDTLASMNCKIDTLVNMIFTLMRTPEERRLIAYAEEKGGSAIVLEDDRLLQDMINMQKSQKEAVETKLLWDTPTLLLDAFRAEVEKNVDTVLKENIAFDNKFREQSRQIQELKEVVAHHGDRVIAVVQAGPHSRVTNKVCSSAQTNKVVTNRCFRNSAISGGRWQVYNFS